MGRDDMDIVLDEGVRLAIRFLEKYGEFYPFAVAKTLEGEICHVQGWSGEDQPPSDQVIKLLYTGLRQSTQAGKYSTTALVSDVRLRDTEVPNMTDIIKIEIEDANTSPITCYLSYSLANGIIHTGEMKAEAGKHCIFVNSR